MSKKHSERILCAFRRDLPAPWLPATGAVRLDWDALLVGLAPVPPQWLVRADVERDPSVKQWIPYVILRRTDGAVACYPRQGTEARLHGLWSVGIGGHVNPVDHDAGAAWEWRSALIAGLKREVEEEAPGVPIESAPRCLGVINEDATSVGSVHIGLVCELPVADGRSVETGEELRGMVWEDPGALAAGRAGKRLELWSELALRLLADAADAE